MANLDTRSKRASSTGFWKPYAPALPLPDGGVSQGDRQHSAWSYSGILAAEAEETVVYSGVRVPISFRDKRAVIEFRDKRGGVKRRG